MSIDKSNPVALLEWARGCVPYLSDCHKAICDYLDGLDLQQPVSLQVGGDNFTSAPTGQPVDCRGAFESWYDAHVAYTPDKEAMFMAWRAAWDNGTPKRESGDYTFRDMQRAYDAGWNDNENGLPHCSGEKRFVNPAAPYIEALTPSPETKAAYIGEFSFSYTNGTDDKGNDIVRGVTVPWDVTKKIMAKILERATTQIEGGN